MMRLFIFPRYKNMQEVFDGYKHKVSQEGTLCQLIVINVGPDDCGEVECRAYNNVGTATSRAHLHLQGQGIIGILQELHILYF